MLLHWKHGLKTEERERRRGDLLLILLVGVQHSPANMGFLFLAVLHGSKEVTWLTLFTWNILPAALGNLMGGWLLAVSLWYEYGPSHQELEKMKQYV